MLNNKKHNVHIYNPDYSLQVKIGVKDMDQLFTTKSVSRAQTYMGQLSQELLDECVGTMKMLRVAYQNLKSNPTQTNPSLPQIVDTSFSIKTHTAQGGNILASSLASSLQRHAEQALLEGLSSKTISIMDWHIDSLNLFLKKNIKGYGGDAGEALLRELGKLEPNKPKNSKISTAA